MTRNTLMFLMLALLLGGAAFADERRAADTIDATTIHRAVADPSLYLEPALTVANPSLDRGIEIRIVVWSSSVETRRVHQVQLEAGGTLQVSLDSVARFDRLAVQSADRFDARLESLVDGAAEQLVFEGGPQVASRFLFPCHGMWTLTCINCSHPPATSAGYIMNGTRVFWNLNEPTGVPYQTINHQGITANWSNVGLDGCPIQVSNSLGDIYSVSIQTNPDPFHWPPL